MTSTSSDEVIITNDGATILNKMQHHHGGGHRQRAAGALRLTPQGCREGCRRPHSDGRPGGALRLQLPVKSASTSLNSKVVSKVVNAAKLDMIDLHNVKIMKNLAAPSTTLNSSRASSSTRRSATPLADPPTWRTPRLS
ncbi:hypothetical protein E2542_SST19249 [Spatholobus suberectus]|nr:hypothetical protein E2542_SST19249 [Spatholobus suberectus]